MAKEDTITGEVTGSSTAGTETGSRKDAHLERLRKKYPEKKFEDDEEIYGTISDDYDAYEKELSDYRGREKTLSDMFAADPRSAFFLNDMREGTDPVIGLVKRFGMEVKDILDDPEMQEKLKEANKEYLERVARSKELDEEYDKNMESTLATLNQYQESHGLSDDQIDELSAAWLQIVRDGVMGKLTPETITLIANALNHDSDVEQAQLEGEVAGRNAKIEERLRKREEGDGVPALQGKNNPEKNMRRQSIFDLARDA